MVWTRIKNWGLCIIGILVLVIALIPVFYGVQIANRINIGRRLAAETTPFNKTTGSTKKILIVGDSLAYGVGASSPEKSISGQISKKFPEANIINKATIGDDTADLLKDLPKKIDQNYDIIVVIIGGNDIIRFPTDLEHTSKNMENIIQFSSRNSSRTFVITSGDFRNVSFVPPFLKGYFAQRANLLRQQTIEFAGNHHNVTYIDAFSIPESDYKNYEAPDHFHLNDAGIARLVALLLISEPLSL